MEKLENKNDYGRIVGHYKFIITVYTLLFIGAILILLPASIKGIDPRVADLLNAFGIGLVPAAIISLFYEYFIRKYFLLQMKSELHNVISSNFQNVQRINAAGIVDVQSNFPSHLIFKTLETSKKEIKILQTWIPEILTLKQYFLNIIKNNGEIKILLLNPDSALTRYRNQDLGFSKEVNQVALKIKDTIETLRVFFKDSIANNSDLSVEQKRRFVVKAYDMAYLFSLYSGDDTHFIGFYWNNKTNTEGPQFILEDKNSDLCKSFNSHFERIWNDAERTQIIIAQSE